MFLEGTENELKYAGIWMLDYYYCGDVNDQLPRPPFGDYVKSRHRNSGLFYEALLQAYMSLTIFYITSKFIEIPECL